MIPQNNFDDVIEKIDNTSNNFPSKTYGIDFKSKKVVGFIDNIESIKQTIFSILSTERYEHLIFSFDYGVELQDLIGEDPIYVKADIHRRVEEALLQDDRILSVDNPSIATEGDCLFYSCTVNTIYGNIDIEREVAY